MDKYKENWDKVFGSNLILKLKKELEEIKSQGIDLLKSGAQLEINMGLVYLECARRIEDIIEANNDCLDY